jgi:ABC-2 type transport system permease protein
MTNVETAGSGVRPAAVVRDAGMARAGARDGVRQNLRAVLLLWRREMRRLRRSPTRIAMGLVTPLMFLVVLGTGLEASGVMSDQLRSYRTYLFPGVLIMAVQAPAIAVGISIVWDRRMGVLRQMLVAPMRRGSIVFGLALGGATTGVVYGLMVLAVAGIADISYSPVLLLVLFEVFLVSLAFTALGLLAAVTIKSVDTFQIVVGLSMMPLMFFSGAMFPPNGLPGWLGYLVKANPITYAVDAVRRTLPGSPYLSPGGAEERLTLAGWVPPVLLELGLLGAVSAAALAVATYRFSRTE